MAEGAVQIAASVMERLAIRDVPRLRVSREVRKPKQYDPAKEYRFRYKSKRHSRLPHVVKFSGGRSSGMLLFALLENGILDRERGMSLSSTTRRRNIRTHTGLFGTACGQPEAMAFRFFQIEFQTYEDAWRGEWTRIPSYRLVNDRPKSEANPDGFHWRGEVFEELLSWKGYVPNRFNRICTQHLKLDVTRSFLRDWFASKPTIPRLGHYGNGSRIDADATYPEASGEQGQGAAGDIRREAFLCLGTTACEAGAIAIGISVRIGRHSRTRP